MIRDYLHVAESNNHIICIFISVSTYIGAKENWNTILQEKKNSFESIEVVGKWMTQMGDGKDGAKQILRTE